MSAQYQTSDAHHFVAGYNPEFVRNVHRKRREAARQRLAEERQFAAERLAVKIAAERAAENQRRRELESARAIAAYREVPTVTGEQMSARDIIRNVALANGTSFKELVGRSRYKPVVAARMKAILEVKRHKPHWSLPQIGRVFNRDHTTILHALRKMGWSDKAKRGTQT